MMNFPSLKDEKMDSINSLLLSEFFTATGYLDRLLFALTELENHHLSPTGKNLIQKTCFEFYSFYASNLPEFNFDLNSYEFKLSTFKKQLKSFHQTAEHIIKLPLTSTNKNKFAIEYINQVYKSAHEFHNFTLAQTHFDIQYPRNGMIQETVVEAEALDIHSTPLFFLEEKDFLEENIHIDFLDFKREEKYDHFIRRGHAFMTEKNFKRAEESFYKARNFIETAEVLTLLAWTHSLQGDNEKAKTYCLKAIQKDDNYGPAFNDYGNYLLLEGKTEEALRFFALAKKATNYQNREYPYINCGRALVGQKKYQEALKEFSDALTIAPFHEELHQTVMKLKWNLDRDNPNQPLS
jgi:tetratricopeptide (TPR) repeat protein